MQRSLTNLLTLWSNLNMESSIQNQTIMNVITKQLGFVSFLNTWKSINIFNAHQACAMLHDGKSIQDIIITYLEQSQIHLTTQNVKFNLN